MLKQGNLFEFSHNVGTITEFMKSSRIRSISARNYIKWKGYDDVESMFPIATVRLDLFDGRLKMFDHNNKMLSEKEADKICGAVYELVSEISENEKLIPYKKRRNIIVKINR